MTENQAPTRAELIAQLKATYATTPLVLKLAALIVLLESLALWVITGLTISDALSPKARSLGMLLSLALLTMALAWWTAYAARGLALQKRWARSASIVWQLLQLSIASASFTGQFANATIGVAIAVPSLLVLVLLFTPAAVQATKDN